MSSEVTEIKENRKYLKAPDITLRVTDRCDLACIHCFADSSKGAENELTTDEIKGIIEWMSSNGSFRLGLTGGEPTLREDILEIAAYAKEHNLWTILTTNAFSLAEELCKGLRDIAIDQVDVSLDNSSADAHDHFRGRKGSFARATEAVRMLRSFGITTAITSVISSWNFDDLPSLYQLARELGASCFKADAFIAIGRGDTNLALTSEQFKYVCEWMDSLDDPDITVDRFSEKFDFLSNRECSPNILEVMFGHKGIPVCEAGITRCTILADGTVQPCSYFCTPEFYAGNIREKTLDEIWNESEVLNKLRNAGTFEDTCQTCEYNTMCRGGCRARAYYMGGNLYGPDPYCWVASKGDDDVQED